VTGRVDDVAPAKPVHDRGEVGLRQVVDAAEGLGRVDARVERQEHVALGPVDPLGHQGDDVTVAPVLAQHGGGVPQPGDRVVGDRQRAEGGVHDAALDGRGHRSLGEQVCGALEPGRADQVAQDAHERGDAALLPGGVGSLGRRGLPDLGDVPCHLARCEVVERGVDDLGRHPAERRGTAGEVAVPVPVEAERRHRVVGLVGEEVDQRYRLDEVEHPPGHGLCTGHDAPVKPCWRHAS
jgi:hypothetical protein